MLEEAYKSLSSHSLSGCLFHLFSFVTNLFLDEENKARRLLWEPAAGSAKKSRSKKGHSEGAACTISQSAQNQSRMRRGERERGELGG